MNVLCVLNMFLSSENRCVTLTFKFGKRQPESFTVQVQLHD